MRDGANNLIGINAINMTAISGNGTTTGVEIDRGASGELGESITFFTKLGLFTDGTYTPVVYDGDVSGSLSAVTDANLIGTEAGAALTATNTVGKIGYVGAKRYLRIDIVASGVTTGATIDAIAVLGHLLNGPNTTQIQ